MYSVSSFEFSCGHRVVNYKIDLLLQIGWLNGNVSEL